MKFGISVSGPEMGRYKWSEIIPINDRKSAGLAGVSSEMGLDDGLLVCTLLLLI